MSAADNVIDLQEQRALRRPESVPAEALHELDLAGRVYDALLAQGHELRFDLPPGGPVRAELRSLEGHIVRPVALAEVLGLEDPVDHPAA